MSKQSNNPTLIGLTQQLKPDLWTWADDPQNATALDCDVLSLGTYLVERLEAFGCKVKDAYAIIHDKDEQDRWNEVTRCYDRVPKERHIHAVFRFADRKSSASVEQLAGFLGVEPQYVEKPKAGRYAFDNMLAYLVHAKYPDKYQYPAEEVATLRGKNYMDIHAERREVWARGAATIKTKNANESADYLRDLILEGLVSKEQVMLTDDLFTIYSRHKQMMDEAFGAYGQRRAYQAASKLRNGDFRTTVIYIYGDAGSGKTYFAQQFITCALAMARERGENWHMYRAATANPLDDWQGQEVIFLDDLRGSAMEANDWLLLLDPVNASPARARYANKQEVAPRLIVLTATIPPDRYFFYTRNKGNVDEALDQFIRRLAAQVKVQYVDDRRSYFVSPVGRLEEPRQLELGRGDHQQIVEMSFGAQGSIEHSADGAVGSLMGYLNTASPDIAFSESDGWKTTLQLVETETRQVLGARVAKALEADPLVPALTPEEVAALEEERRAQEEAERREREECEARWKAAAEEREAAAKERKRREEETLAATKAELASKGQIDLLPKVSTEWRCEKLYISVAGVGSVLATDALGRPILDVIAREKAKPQSPWVI